MTVSRIVTSAVAAAGAALVLVPGVTALANPVAHASAASVAMPAVGGDGAIGLMVLGGVFLAASVLLARTGRRRAVREW
jgi:hypothetical protein